MRVVKAATANPTVVANVPKTAPRTPNIPPIIPNIPESSFLDSTFVGDVFLPNFDSYAVSLSFDLLKKLDALSDADGRLLEPLRPLARPPANLIILSFITLISSAILGKAIVFCAVVLELVLISCKTEDVPVPKALDSSEILLPTLILLSLSVAEYPLPKTLRPTIEPIPEPPNRIFLKSYFSLALFPKAEEAPLINPLDLYS